MQQERVIQRVRNVADHQDVQRFWVDAHGLSPSREFGGSSTGWHLGYATANRPAPPKYFCQPIDNQVFSVWSSLLRDLDGVPESSQQYRSE